jgi:methylmalonyl-CoA/ethylmalonyl-CoA epimerase
MIDLAFHHVGVGTADLEGAIAAYVQLGHRLHTSIDDYGLNIRVAFLSCPGGRGPWIELLAPLGPDGPLSALIRRRALPTAYHTCYAVDDLAIATDELRAAGFLPLAQPASALAMGGAQVCFLFNSCTGLMELVESPPPWLSPSRHDLAPPAG